jgi:hypothetical protein
VGAFAAVFALLGLVLAGVPATFLFAADLQTINDTDAYVDPSIAIEFITVPNLCDEPLASAGTSITACGELGLRAVLAIQGSSPFGDVYWEPFGAGLSTDNAFVPGNSGSNVNDTGYAELFSNHKYDLFGSPTDIMGPLTRREILLLAQTSTNGGGITTGQTTYGTDTLLALVSILLIQPEGATTAVGVNGHDFDFADLPTYENLTGFTSGKLATVHAHCLANYGALFCGIATDEIEALLYIIDNVVAGNFPNFLPNDCGTQQNNLVNTANCMNRDQWMDQVVTGYVESWEILGGDQHFAQNFRSQVGYDPTATVLDSGTEIWGDFRLEQSVELSGAFTSNGSDPGDTITPGDNMEGIASRQTFQYALATESTDEFGWLYGNRQVGEGIGEMVSQDVQGFFMSCLNCEQNVPGGNMHGFTPAVLDLVYQPYVDGWTEIPTIAHRGRSP